MNDAISVLAGIGLMAAGIAAVGYAVYLTMIRAAPLRWWDRAVLLIPAGLAAILGGLLMTR